MLERFDLLGKPVTSLDLKSVLVGTGIQYPQAVYDAVKDWARLEPPNNPYACNCLILPGEVAVHLHPEPQSPYSLDLDDQGEVCIYHDDQCITEVTFPATSDYYVMKTDA